VAFGEKWSPSIIPMEILCLTALASSLSVTAGPVTRAKGRPDLELKIGLLAVGLIVPSLVIGIRFGMVGIAAGTAVTNVIVWLAIQVVANKVIGLRIKEYVYSLGPAFFGSVVMALILLGFRYVASMVLDLPDIVLLIIAVVLGVTTYIVSLRLIASEALNEMVALGREVVRPFARWIIAKMPWAQKNVSHCGVDEEGQKYTIYVHPRK
jgi:O-antigen/teichoic acid export membrane protein